MRHARIGAVAVWRSRIARTSARSDFAVEDKIRVDPEGGFEPYYFPQGHATMFYGNHHGRYRLQGMKNG